MNEQDKYAIQKFLASIPDEFRIIEGQINREDMMEFHQMSQQLRKKPIANEGDTNYSDKEKLVILAKTGDVSSYRKIEAFIQSGEQPELNGFAQVALKFARVKLESQLSDEPIGFISSGLGGKGNKLRYYFAITSAEKINPKREQHITEELQLICKKTDSELESIENFGKYVLVKILVSMEHAIGLVIEALIEKCEFADEGYFCTNVERPTEELIGRWINGEFDDVEE